MITATAPVTEQDRNEAECIGCAGAKKAPIATLVDMGSAFVGADPHKRVFFALCEICGRDLANAVGFMCIKDGSWSKLEPRKRKTK